MPTDRALTTNELSILERILQFDFPGAEVLRHQLAATRATTGCECGCATIDLFVNQTETSPATDAPSPLPVTGTTEDGLGGVIAFARDGWLSCLEIYSVGDDPIAEFPPVESIVFAFDPSGAV